MAKFYGAVGFAETRETRPGIWEECFTERTYAGDMLSSARKLENGSSINDDIALSNRLSIVADPYADTHFFAIRYIRWMKGLWKVDRVEVQRPRIILTIGGVYNGPTDFATHEAV